MRFNSPRNWRGMSVCLSFALLWLNEMELEHRKWSELELDGEVVGDKGIVKWVLHRA